MTIPLGRYWTLSGFIYRQILQQSRQKLKVLPAGKVYPPGTVTIACNWCRTPLFKYHREFHDEEDICFYEKILGDLTDNDRRCPLCQNVFAVYMRIEGRQAYRLRERQTRVLEDHHLRNVQLPSTSTTPE